MLASLRDAGRLAWAPGSSSRAALLTTYTGYLNTDFAALGVTTAKKDAFLSLVSPYTSARAAKNTYESQGAPIYQTYRDLLKAMTAEWRTLTGEIMGRRETTPVQRAALGLPATATAADTATPYLNAFAEADAGKTAHWALCWKNSSGQRDGQRGATFVPHFIDDKSGAACRARRRM